ncbi:phosphotransferase, partial [Ilumatobacter nonamiensis]|uniref:phosphotransferase n=1 Tax=Ilumatobacter nonamiensis TaxID=467093 RepID=UPI00058C4364
LAVSLPIPIPAPVRVGRPALGYPWNWSINPWMPGSVAAVTPFAAPSTEADRLGRFLAALHTPAPPDAPPNPYRGHFIADNTSIFTERVERLRGTAGFAADRVLDRWKELVEVERFGDVPHWIHGDLHALNVLVDDGTISAVIDFGDVCAGDPATDLSAAWSLFEPGVHERVRAAAGDVDEAMWQRAEAWALHFAVVYLSQAADNPTMRALGHTMLTRLGVT